MIRVIFILSLFSYYSTLAQNNVRFNHILITNDDGIEDADRLIALAKSVKAVANRVSIIVSSFDRSGTSNHTTVGKHQLTLQVTCKYYDKENNITAYVTPGNPADCVLLGLQGLFQDDKPDLVLSRINGGANIGPEWFGSGTIGAIRTAAFLGVPGIALSGFDDDDERSFKLIPQWITKLISSGLLSELTKNSYLTIGFPKVPLEKINGVKLSSRKISFDKPELITSHKILGDDPHKPENSTVWSIKYTGAIRDSVIKQDDAFLKEGYIIITPMSIDENNTVLFEVLQKKRNQIPDFIVK